jgi:hypothetical protein
MDRTFVVALLALLVAALAFGQAAGFELPSLAGVREAAATSLPEGMSDIGLVLPRAYPAPVDPGPVPYPQPGASQPQAAPLNVGSRGEGGTEGVQVQVIVPPKWALQPDDNPGDFCTMQVGVLLRFEPKNKSVMPHAEIPQGALMYREMSETKAPGWLLVSGMGQLGWVKDNECK